MTARPTLCLALALAAVPAVAAGQDMGGLLSKLGGARSGAGAAGLLGGAGANNIVGLLGYCVRNQLLGGAGATGSGTAAAPAAAGGSAGGTGASALLGRLTSRQGVTQSPDYLAGDQGVVRAGGANLPLGSLGDTVKQQVCRTVLSRASGLLGRR